MLPNPTDQDERTYFKQFGDAEPEPHAVAVYTVMNYYGRFAIFESVDYDESLQVATWDSLGTSDDLPVDRIVSHPVMYVGDVIVYESGGFFWLDDKPEQYREALTALYAANQFT